LAPPARDEPAMRLSLRHRLTENGASPQ
jgi:hypothetical protein